MSPVASDPEELLNAIADAEIIDVITDALGDALQVGVVAGAVLIGVRSSPAILDTPERRDRFIRAYAEAERQAEAHAAPAVSETDT